MSEHECSKGQADRCRSSKSPHCTCACGGWNHGNQAARRKAERDAGLVTYDGPEIASLSPEAVAQFNRELDELAEEILDV